MTFSTFRLFLLILLLLLTLQLKNAEEYVKNSRKVGMYTAIFGFFKLRLLAFAMTWILICKWLPS